MSLIKCFKFLKCFQNSVGTSQPYRFHPGIIPRSRYLHVIMVLFYNVYYNTRFIDMRVKILYYILVEKRNKELKIKCAPKHYIVDTDDTSIYLRTRKDYKLY